MDSNASLLEFPCDFPIKVMGRAEQDFDALVVGIIREHVSNIPEGAIKSRYSRDRHYVSVTVTIRALNQQQIDAIYLSLSQQERVLMAL